MNLVITSYDLQNPNMPSMWLFGSGLLLVIIGLSFQHRQIKRYDRGAMIFLHATLSGLTSSFEFLWPLGTTPVTLLMISMVFMKSIKIGTITTAVYILIALMERLIKMSTKRKRPFLSLDEINMSQPSRPKDSSHPSGDAMRVWFLSLTIPILFDLRTPAYVFSTFLAAGISLGRIALGVHFPLDVLSGMGLGFMGTAVVLFAVY